MELKNPILLSFVLSQKINFVIKTKGIKEIRNF